MPTSQKKEQALKVAIELVKEAARGGNQTSPGLLLKSSYKDVLELIVDAQKDD